MYTIYYLTITKIKKNKDGFVFSTHSKQRQSNFFLHVVKIIFVFNFKMSYVSNREFW